MDSSRRAQQPPTMDQETAIKEPNAGCAAPTTEPPHIEATAAAVLAAARASVQLTDSTPPAADDFQPQAQRKRPRRDAPTSAVPSTSTSNRFAALEDDDDDMFNSDPSAPAKEYRPPPIVIRNKAKWVSIAGHISSSKLNFTKARAIQDGIQIQPATQQDFREITRLLDVAKEEYHTFLLPEEKPLRVVIRGIDPAIDIEDVKEFFSVSEFPVTSVRRTTGRDNRPLKLIMVTLDRSPEAKGIYKMKTVLHLPITVETPNRKPNQVSQCHKCQRFNHSQRGCHAKPRCVKCGGDHHTATCQKKKEQDPLCCNCGGTHPASYRGCTGFPKTRRPQATPTKPTQPASTARPIPKPPTNMSAWPALPSRQPTAHKPNPEPTIPAPPTSIPAPPPKTQTPKPAPSGPFDIFQLLKLLSNINIQRLVTVSRKVIAALSNATTPEETLAGLLSIAADIYSLFQP